MLDAEADEFTAVDDVGLPGRDRWRIVSQSSKRWRAYTRHARNTLFSFFFERITKKTVKKMGKASQNNESYVKCVKMRAQLPEEAPLAKTVTRASCALRKGRL